jgi:hypothetical protein
VAKTLEDLRTHLFATLASLRDEDNPMDVDRARAISDVAKTVIDSAKAEIDYIKATGNESASLAVFAGAAIEQKDNQPNQNEKLVRLPNGAVAREHRLKG